MRFGFFALAVVLLSASAASATTNCTQSFNDVIGVDPAYVTFGCPADVFSSEAAKINHDAGECFIACNPPYEPTAEEAPECLNDDQESPCAFCENDSWVVYGCELPSDDTTGTTNTGATTTTPIVTFPTFPTFPNTDPTFPQPTTTSPIPDGPTDAPTTTFIGTNNAGNEGTAPTKVTISGNLDLDNIFGTSGDSSASLGFDDVLGADATFEDILNLDFEEGGDNFDSLFANLDGGADDDFDSDFDAGLLSGIELITLLNPGFSAALDATKDKFFADEAFLADAGLSSEDTEFVTGADMFGVSFTDGEAGFTDSSGNALAFDDSLEFIGRDASGAMVLADGTTLRTASFLFPGEGQGGLVNPFLEGPAAGAAGNTPFTFESELISFSVDVAFEDGVTEDETLEAFANSATTEADDEVESEQPVIEESENTDSGVAAAATSGAQVSQDEITPPAETQQAAAATSQTLQGANAPGQKKQTSTTVVAGPRATTPVCSVSQGAPQRRLLAATTAAAAKKASCKVYTATPSSANGRAGYCVTKPGTAKVPCTAAEVKRTGRFGSPGSPMLVADKNCMGGAKGDIEIIVENISNSPAALTVAVEVQVLASGVPIVPNVAWDTVARFSGKTIILPSTYRNNIASSAVSVSSCNKYDGVLSKDLLVRVSLGSQLDFFKLAGGTDLCYFMTKAGGWYWHSLTENGKFVPKNGNHDAFIGGFKPDDTDARVQWGTFWGVSGIGYLDIGGCGWQTKNGRTFFTCGLPLQIDVRSLIGATLSKAQLTFSDGFAPLARFSGRTIIDRSVYYKGMDTGREWVSPCGNYAGYQKDTILRLTMGDFVDYFKVFAGTSVCQFLSSSRNNQYFHSYKKTGFKRTAGNHNLFLGGFTPYGAGDNRAWGSFWGISRATVTKGPGPKTLVDVGGCGYFTKGINHFSCGRPFEWHIKTVRDLAAVPAPKL